MPCVLAARTAYIWKFQHYMTNIGIDSMILLMAFHTYTVENITHIFCKKKKMLCFYDPKHVCHIVVVVQNGCAETPPSSISIQLINPIRYNNYYIRSECFSTSCRCRCDTKCATAVRAQESSLMNGNKHGGTRVAHTHHTQCGDGGQLWLHIWLRLNE